MKALFLLFSVFLFFPIEGKTFGVSRLFMLDVSNMLSSLSLRIGLNNREGKKKYTPASIRFKYLLSQFFQQKKEKNNSRHRNNDSTSIISTLLLLTKMFQHNKESSTDTSFNAPKIIAKHYSLIIFFILEKKLTRKDKSEIFNELLSNESSLLFMQAKSKKFPKYLSGFLLKKYYDSSYIFCKKKRFLTLDNYTYIINRIIDNTFISIFTLSQRLYTEYINIIEKYTLIRIFSTGKRVIKNTSKEYSPLLIRISKRDIPFLIATAVILSNISISDDVIYKVQKKLWNNREQRKYSIADINRLVKNIANLPFWTMRKGLRYLGNCYPQVLGREK